MRTWLKVISGLLGAYLVLCVGLFAAMCQPPGVFGSIMSKVPMPLTMVFPFGPLWTLARSGNLEMGELAPDFDLPTPDKKSQVRLSSFRGHKPVVLVFGSYT